MSEANEMTNPATKGSEVETLVMCEFHHGTYECRGDGYIWDADYDGWDPEDLSMPCPMCNTLTYLRGAKDEAESTSSYFGPHGHGEGVDIWRGALASAKHWNPGGVDAALKEVRRVEALKSDDDGENNPSVEVFSYT